MSGRASGSDLVVGSWRRTAAIAVVIVAVAVVAVAYFGGLGPLRQASYPGHPYPPSGYTANPFGGDLINASDAQRIKEDFLNDGAIELQAFQRGDSSLLAQSDTGSSLIVRHLLSRGPWRRWGRPLSPPFASRTARR
jgi:hypothetical protein